MTFVVLTQTKTTFTMKVKKLSSAILGKMHDINKWQSDFISTNFDLQCCMRSRHNFLNMCRYSDYNEATFHNNYQKAFDFMEFNRLLVEQFCSDEQIIAFDPSHISKSGKKTPGVYYFWSGCAGAAKWGLEIGGFAVVDIINNTAMHLIAEQTLAWTDYPSLLEYYAALIVHHSENLKKTSNYLAVDAYFSRFPFVEKAFKAGLHTISRLRDDANLLYPYVGPHPKRKGAKTKYLGKFDPLNLNDAYFTCCIDSMDEEAFRVYEGTLYSVALKREIRVAVYRQYNEDGSIKCCKLFFSTDTTLSGIDIYCYYKGRYQIEFLYRDAKQFAGLEHCQSRSESKLHFHFNTALTTVSLAKAIYHLDQPIEKRKPFSMADVKTQYSNELIWDLIIQRCGLSPHEPKIKEIKQYVLAFGKIRA